MKLPKCFNLDLSDEALFDKLEEECEFNNDNLDGFRFAASIYDKKEKIDELIKDLKIKENLFDAVFAYDFRKDADKKELLLSYLAGLIYAINKTKM